MGERTVVHELKTWPDPFQTLYDGRKTFEIRQDDRGGFKVGDVLRLEEYTPPTGAGVGQYTGRWLVRRVSYIARGWGLPDGLVVLALADDVSLAGEGGRG